jgi:hypothetical protein
MIGSRIARWLTVLLIAASGPPLAAWAETQSVAPIRVPTPQAGQPRKVVIVRGVELSGTLVMRYERGCAYLNDLEWLPAPRPNGFMIPKATFDASELSPAAVRMFQSAPRVVQLQRQGLTRNRAIETYVEQQDSLLEYVSDVYRKAIPRGKGAADRAARLAIDPGLASVDSAGPLAPSFSGAGSVTLFFLGHGFRGLMRDGSTREPTPRETAEFLSSRAKGQYERLRSMLELEAPVLAVYTADAAMLFIGGDATRGFAELDRLHAAGSAAARREIARSFKALPVNLAVELEQAHAFDHER